MRLFVNIIMCGGDRKNFCVRHLHVRIVCITLHSEIAERTTRSVNDNNVYVPYAHLESFKNSFTHRGPIMWNSLLDYINTCGTLHSFKAKMKLYIMN